MREQDPVGLKLQELTQQMVHVVQPYNEEKGIIKEEFDTIEQDLNILVARICTKNARIEVEVSGVVGQMIVQQASINEMRQGIVILQGQDGAILQEAGEIFQGIHKQLYNMIKKHVDSG